MIFGMELEVRERFSAMYVCNGGPQPPFSLAISTPLDARVFGWSNPIMLGCSTNESRFATSQFGPELTYRILAAGRELQGVSNKCTSLPSGSIM